MIVICTRCQTKFRVADDKIGPRGAKVRCSKCKTVFLVHPELGTMPAHEDGPPPRAASPDREFPGSTANNPFVSSPVRAAPPPPRAAPPPLPPPPTPRFDDPFGAAGLGGPAEPGAFGSSPPADPFDAPAQDDPFAAATGSFDRDPLPRAEADPFSPGADPDPFPYPEPDAPSIGIGAPALAVTDLSDLGIAAPGGGPAPVDYASPPDLELPGGPPPRPVDDGDGLSLEERTTPPPRPFPPPASSFSLDEDPLGGPSAGADPFAAAAAFDPGSYELGAREEGLALATEPRHVEREPEPERRPPPPPPPEAPRTGPQKIAVEAALEDRVPGSGGSRLRAVVVNAVGLAALLLAVLAILAIWRNDGRFDAASLRPGALLGALRDEVKGPFATRDVTSGLYERDRAPPLLFVRGVVVSQAPAAVPGVTVAVEVVREGRVIARGEARAGAIPTPEELHGARDAARLDGVTRAAAERAPAEVKPGDAVPFLVAMDGPPADLHGASLRIVPRAAEEVAP